MSVVQVIWGADGHVIKRSGRSALELERVLLEAFEFREKLALWGDTVDDADRVIDVVGHGQPVARVFDGMHMARCDVARSTDKGKVFHVF